MAKGIGISTVTNDYHQILSNPNIDAVLICSPTDTHPQILIEAAETGKHIFCEKPVSFSLGETKKALQKTDELGIKLQVGFNRRFDHNFHRAHTIRIENDYPNTAQLLTSTGVYQDKPKFFFLE
jgi:myo-inositol 2-dehydrogenase / D-chiro-inositol 1-dehydrogenase